jgi:hypothetical protein
MDVVQYNDASAAIVTFWGVFAGDVYDIHRAVLLSYHCLDLYVRLLP